MSKTRKQRGMKPNKPRTPRQIGFDIHQRIMNARPGDVIDEREVARLTEAEMCPPGTIYMGTPFITTLSYAGYASRIDPPAEPIDPDY
jgi:hypothetical protein